MRSIELLAPARDLATGLEAIRHGADAVYIGAERFGARAAAGNSLQDIRELCRYAHVFGVKVYVTVNTIIFDDELEDTRRLIWDLYEAGVDALIVQDMALLRMDLPPIPLHASTQMDNRTADKVRWLHQLGFEQAVLARELTLDEIADIHHQVPEMPLEVFVHGSICVCYNGRCYASQHSFGRSANRGECAQVCRLAFDLEDAEGRVIERQRHLLSMRDMNRTQDLEALLDAGATSLKIEGRLKDPAYVKNVVAHYRRVLDGIFRRRPEDYKRASLGEVKVDFDPRPEASFNRGFTSYFLHGRTRDLCNPITPKSMGERVGIVKDIRPGCIIVSGLRSFSNGDGLCFVDTEGQLQGFRVNRVDNNKLYPQQMPHGLQPRMQLYRNQDQAMEHLLSRPTAERRLGVKWLLQETPTGFSLRLTTRTHQSVVHEWEHPHELARSPQREQIERQLSRLGDTPYVCQQVDVEMSDNWFIPGSTLAEWRRQLTEECQAPAHRAEKPAMHTQTPLRLQPEWVANVANHLAREFYEQQGATDIPMTLEYLMRHGQQEGEGPLMTCRYCIRYQLGLCSRQGRMPWREPLYLRAGDGRRFRLRFDCKNCQMLVYAE